MMKANHLLLVSLFFFSCSGNRERKNNLQFNPPATRRVPVTDTYFGMEVTDNYRWLENLKDSTVLNWLKAQSNYTNSWLDKIPGRDSLAAEMARLDAKKPADISDFTRKGNRYFFKKTLPQDKTGKLYYREGKNGRDILLYDPGVDQKSIPYSINSFEPSEDGSKVALLISKGGAEVGHARVLEVASGKLLADDLYPCSHYVAWTPDDKGILYLLLQTANNHSMDFERNSRTMYHVLGTDTSEDKELFSRQKYPELDIKSSDFCVAAFTEDFQHIIGYLYTVDRNLTCFYASASDLLKPHIPWKPLLKKKDHVTNFVMDGDDVYMQTYEDAPNFKIIKSNLNDFSVARARTVIPEGKNHISYFARSKDYLFINYDDGINSTVRQYNLHSGELKPVKLPLTGNGGLSPFGIEANDGLIFLTSWKQPLTIYDYNADDRHVNESAFNIQVTYPGVQDIKVIETEIKSHDGTMVPLSIFYNKNVRLDGQANCLLEGYGAYGISMTPYFSTMMLALINKGVIIAQAHVRGGGEKGDAWHQAGFITTKPNTWKDFIACAAYLIKNNYTAPHKLTGMGISAGGITIGRAITERPDLFGAAIDNVGCTDALRAENAPNGPVNVPEFGTIKDSVESRALYEMDAFQHVKKGAKYPAVICVGGINDPRVIVWQPAKFAAALQWATASEKPVLLDVNYNNGHFTEDKSVTFKNFANMFAFALWQTGHPDFQINEKKPGL